MSAIEWRELNEQEATTVVETIGDTPVHGVFVDDRLVAVTPAYGDTTARVIATALMVRDDHDALPDELPGIGGGEA